MPWKSKGVMESRIEFVVRASAGEQMSSLCREFGISRVTGYHWLSRYQESYQATELKEKSRCPHHCPHKTEESIEAEILKLRRRYGWGARKLISMMSFPEVAPSERTVNRIIKRNNLIDPRDEHHPALRRFEREKPNQLWQVDFKGPMRNHAGKKSIPLSLLDDSSRFAVGLHDLESTHGAKVIKCFRRTFREFGLPDEILLDHGTPWWSSSSEHGLTQTAVWLIKKDIKICFSRIRHPQTQGKVERFHRTLGHWVRYHQAFTCQRWQPQLDAFRKEYNEIRPHEALNMNVPASRYSPSTRLYQEKSTAWNYPQDKGSIIKLDPQGKFRRQGKHLFVCEALANEYVQLTELNHSILVSFRDMYIRELYPDTGTSAPLVCPKSFYEV